MRKRLLSICLALCMMLALVPQMEVKAEAASEFQPIWPVTSTKRVTVLDYYSSGVLHGGMDIAAGMGSTVYAVADGVVDWIRNSCGHYNGGEACGCPVESGNETYGNLVRIRHTINGTNYYSLYAHLKLNSISVSYGKEVKAGDPIALSGASGSADGEHLHLELYKGSRTKAQSSQTFQYYVNQPDILQGISFSSHMTSSSKTWGSWVSANCTYSNGVYVYKATPPKATLSIDRTNYNVGDTVTFTLGDSTAQYFYIGIYKDGERIDGLNVGSTYTRIFNEPGSYSAYMTASNSAGYTDSNWVYWEVAEPNYLERSTYYPSYLKVKTTAKTQLRTLPDSGSELVLTLSKGEVETVTGLYYNPDHEYWYRMEYNGKPCYMYAGHAEVTEFLQGTSIRDVVVPTVLKVGQSLTLEGVISTEYTQLFQAAAAVETGTETLLHAWDGTTSNTYSLKSSNVDHGIPLGSLSTGYYAYIVYVGERSYYWDGDSLESKEIWPAVWRSSFTVGSPAGSTPGKPALKNMQSVYEEGETITFDWDTTVNTTHYSIYVCKENANGAYEIIDELHYYKPTRTYSIEESGNYRIMLQAVNSSALTPDGSTWNHSDGDWVYFRVGCKHASTTKTAAKAATCTTAGNKAYYTCSSCKEIFKDAAATQPTTKAAMTIAKLGHSWDEGKVTTAPSYTADGVMTYTCTRSGCGATKNESIPVLEHDYVGFVTFPTCTEEGYTTYTCTNCGDSYTSDVTEALGHNYVDDVCTRCGNTMEHSWDEGVETLAPTCIAYGERTFTCSTCGETYIENVPSLGHSFNDTVTAPTCSTGGYTTYTCSRCEYSYIDDVTAALGHAYENGICTGCGQAEDTVETAVAEIVIGGVTTSYDDITAAVTALVDTTTADAAVLRLLDDIELTESMIVSGGVFTLDLNGYTLNGPAINNTENSAIKLTNDTDMTLVDSSAAQTGTVMNTGASYHAAIAMNMNAKLTMNSGTLKSADSNALHLQAGTTKAVIYGGVIEADNAVPVYSVGDLQITGGRLISPSLHIIHTDGTVSFKGYKGDPSGIIIRTNAGCDPVPTLESYHLPEGYGFYTYNSGIIGTEPVTELKSTTEYYQSYIIGRLPGAEEPDELTCTITDEKAVLSGSILEDYLETNAQLMMAAYDGKGRFLGIQDGVSQSGDGPYQMIIEAEGIETVRFFVMDGSYIPLAAAYISE